MTNSTTITRDARPEPGIQSDHPRTPRVRSLLFWTLWGVTALLGVSVIAVSRSIGEPSALKAAIPMVPLLALTAGLMQRLGPDRLPATAGAARTSHTYLTLLVLAVVAPLAAAAFLGTAVLVPLAAAAGVAVVVWRHDVRRSEVPVAISFAVLATLGGSANWFATGEGGDLAFALLMLPLVTLSLLAGWAAARRADWEGSPVGRTLIVTDGWKPALKALLFGALIAIP